MGKSSEIPEKYQARYLDRLDGRTAIAGVMRARWRELTDDLGGEDRLSYAKRSLVERALWLEHWLHLQERALAEGRVADFDAGRWTQACNALLGIFGRLGLDRAPKDVTSLSEYVTRKAVND